MATYQLFFNNGQLGNFNTAGFPGGYTGSQSLTINSAHPGDRLVDAGAVSSVSDITGWRFTVEGDEGHTDPSGDGNDVIPYAEMTIEYSTDGGTTWLSYSSGIGHSDAVWYARQDEEGWMAITADIPSQGDGQFGFIVADAGVTTGQVFTTDETIFETQVGEYALPCFVAGTRIETDTGLIAVEQIAQGDLVRTKDNGFKAVQWVGSKTVSLNASEASDRLRPVRIRAGALGTGLPERDLYVSQQHRVLVKSQIAERMTGADEVLIAARKLLEISGIDCVEECDEVTYVHLLFDQHEVVYSNGAETESLYTGPEALKAVGEGARTEILALFPELADMDYRAQSARIIPSGKMAKALADRHAKNEKPLYLA